MKCSLYSTGKMRSDYPEFNVRDPAKDAPEIRCRRAGCRRRFFTWTPLDKLRFVKCEHPTVFAAGEIVAAAARAVESTGLVRGRRHCGRCARRREWLNRVASLPMPGWLFRLCRWVVSRAAVLRWRRTALAGHLASWLARWLPDAPRPKPAQRRAVPAASSALVDEITELLRPLMQQSALGPEDVARTMFQVNERLKSAAAWRLATRSPGSLATPLAQSATETGSS